MDFISYLQFLGLVEGWHLKHTFILKLIIMVFVNAESITPIFPSPPPPAFAFVVAGGDIWI